MSVEEAWTRFKKILSKCMEENVPKTRRKSYTTKVPWWSTLLT